MLLEMALREKASKSILPSPVSKVCSIFTIESYHHITVGNQEIAYIVLGNLLESPEQQLWEVSHAWQCQIV